MSFCHVCCALKLGHYDWWKLYLGKKKRSWAQWSSGIFPAQTALWFYGCVETLGNWEKQEKLCRKNFRLSRFPVSEPLCEGIKKKMKNLLNVWIGLLFVLLISLYFYCHNIILLQRRQADRMSLNLLLTEN